MACGSLEVLKYQQVLWLLLLPLPTPPPLGTPSYHNHSDWPTQVRGGAWPRGPAMDTWLSSQWEPLCVYICLLPPDKASLCQRLFDLRHHIYIGRLCEIQDSPVHNVKTFGLENGHKDIKSRLLVPLMVGDSPSIYRHALEPYTLNWGAGTAPCPGRIVLYLWLFKSWRFPEPKSAFGCEPHCKKIQDIFTSHPLASGRRKTTSSPPAGLGLEGTGDHLLFLPMCPPDSSS